MIATDAIGEIEFWAIMLSLIVVPFLWVVLRKQNSTDREGREPPIPDKRFTGEMDPRSNLPMYGGPGLDYTWRAIGKEWEHPDVSWYKEKVKKEAEEQSQKRHEAPDWKDSPLYRMGEEYLAVMRRRKDPKDKS